MEFKLDRNGFGRTLFDRMKNGNRNIVSPLRMQHRMTKGIGPMIGHCFYDDDLSTGD